MARYKDARTYLQDLQCRQRVATELVEERVAFAQQYQISNHCVSKKHHYKVGDRVLLHNPAAHHGPGYKLARPWEGPFDVLEVVGPVNYRIKQGNGLAKVVHYNRLKPFCRRSASSSSLSYVDSMSSDETCLSSDSSEIRQRSQSAIASPVLCQSTTISSQFPMTESRSDADLADIDSDTVSEAGSLSGRLRRGTRVRRRPRYLSAYV